MYIVCIVYGDVMMSVFIGTLIYTRMYITQIINFSYQVTRRKNLRKRENIHFIEESYGTHMSQIFAYAKYEGSCINEFTYITYSYILTSHIEKLLRDTNKKIYA